MKYVYEVKYSMHFQLFSKEGKSESEFEDFTGPEVISVVGDSDTENMIKKAKKIAFQKHKPFSDVDDDDKKTGKTWKPVKFNLTSISQGDEVYV